MTPPIMLPKKFIELWERAILKHSPRCQNMKMALELHRNNLRLIWQVYTQDRKVLGRLPFTDVRLVAPYLMGFHLTNVARFVGLIDRALQRGLGLPPAGHGPVRVIDLGSGTGAASQAAYLTLNKLLDDKEFEFQLIDRSRHLVQCGEQMLQEMAPTATVRTLAKPLNDPKSDFLINKWLSKPSRLNILCMGYVWNELSPNPRLRGHLLEMMYAFSRNESPAWLFLSEPAAEQSARSTLRLRESLVDMGWQAIYPCLKSVQCPMGPDGRDWCYSEFEAKKATTQIEIEKILQVSRSTLGTAAYALVNPAAAKYFKSTASGRRTVVGRPIGENNGAELLLCNGSEIDRKPSTDKVNKGDLWSPN